MCGIAGIATSTGRAAPAGLVERMAGCLVHRGPDDSGFFEAAGVALGVRRLSIVDVTGGHQPMTSPDGLVTVTQNGEIYNFPALRSELESLGYEFRTRCDTEAILHGYREWGAGVVDRLNGMFALAIWDAERRALVLARDRMGIKPLYYAETTDGLLYASEMKALVRAPGVDTTVDPGALRDYLTYEYVPTPRTMLRGVRQLPPGHLAEYHDGRLKSRPYWRLSLQEEPSRAAASEAELVDELRSRLREAVRLELLSDVPLGVLLSGGIDSSTIAAMMVDLGVDPVLSFSIGFEERSFDESSYARLVAGYLGTRHHELVVTARDVVALMPKLARIADVPLGDSSLVPTFLLSRLARQHVTVALGGEGGDEVFGGYPTLQAHQVARWASRLPSGLLNLGSRLASALPSDSRNISLEFQAKRFFAGVGQSPAVRHHVWMGSVPPWDAAGLLSPDIRGGPSGRAEDVLNAHLAEAGPLTELSQILYLDSKMYLENDILVKSDRASMACSLETRVPLLNRVVVDFMSGVPDRFKVRGLTTKYLLKRAMAGILPREIVARRKKGFNFPVASFLRNELRPTLEDALSEERLRRQGLFDPAAVRRLVDQHLSGRWDHRKPLWTLLTFQLWHAEFIESGR